MTGTVTQWRRRHQKQSDPLQERHHSSAALPVRIYTMGGLRVLFHHGQLETVPASGVRRTELLKVITALGGRNIPETKLAAAMWPCSDGRGACARYDAALAALQDWLNVNGTAVLRVEDGLVSLDERYCWLDTWALDRCCARIRATLADTRRWPYQRQTLAAQTERLVRLYRGDFLQGERAQAWSFALRERLRHVFVSTLAQVGRHWRRIGEPHRAMQCCHQGLVIDRLAEPLYQLLIHCVMEQGRLKEALSIYHDYRNQFIELLGVEPDPASFALLGTGRHEGLSLR